MGLADDDWGELDERTRALVEYLDELPGGELEDERERLLKEAQKRDTASHSKKRYAESPEFREHVLQKCLERSRQRVSCSVCGKEINRGSVRSHMILVHEAEGKEAAESWREKMREKAACELCGKVMNKRWISRHMTVVHEVYGSEVSESVKAKERAAKKRRNVREKRAPCPVCGKVLTKRYVRDHVERVHNKEDSE